MAKRTFRPAAKASITDFFKSSDFVIDDCISYGSMAEFRLERIKQLARKVQESLIEGFGRTGGAGEKLDKLGKAFNHRIDNLDYASLESMKESLSGSFLGLMIVLGLSQKVHGEDYWNKQRGWQDFEAWLTKMNKNIYTLDEEVKKLIISDVKA